MPALTIGIFFLFIAFFVSPAGNFPLNDDWSYGEAVRIFLQSARFDMPTVCAPGFAHVLYGAACSACFGYSYVVLRISTLVLGALGTWFFYLTLREVRIGRATALFVSLVYAANPLMLNIYFSFMSDVAALSLTNLHFYLLARTLKRNSLPSGLLSGLLLLVTISVRQSAIIFLPCSLIILTLSGKQSWLKWCLLAALILFAVLAYAGIDHWLLNRHSFVYHYEWTKECHALLLRKLLSEPLSAIIEFATATGHCLAYLGLFCLPVLLPFITCIVKLKGKQLVITAAWMLFALTIAAISFQQLVIHAHKLMPFDKNIICLPPIGAKGIIGLEMPELQTKYCRILTWISYLSAVLLATVSGALWSLASVFWQRLKEGNSRRQLIAWSITLLCAGSFVLSLFYAAVEIEIRNYERYYLIALMPSLLCIAWLAKWLRLKLNGILSILCLALISIYGILSAQDYLNWNRARWTGLNHLEQQGVSPADIDGGGEYNILHDIKLLASTEHGSLPQRDWRWWPIHGEKYIISFSPVPGYETVEKIPYWNSLLFRHKEIFVLKKSNKEEAALR